MSSKCTICGFGRASHSPGASFEFQPGIVIIPRDVLVNHFDADAGLVDDWQLCQPCLEEVYQLAVLEIQIERAKTALVDKMMSSKLLKQDVDEFADSRPKKRQRRSVLKLEDIGNDGDGPAEEVFIELDAEAWSTARDDPESRLAIYQRCAGRIDAAQRCTLSRVTADGGAHCLGRGCPLRASFDVDPARPGGIVVTLRNGAEHAEAADPSRTLFELSRQQFDSEHACEFCCVRFESAAGLEAHRKASGEGADFLCPRCPAKFRSFQARNGHFLTRHTTDSPYECSNPGCAGKAFKTRYQLAQHERNCASKATFECSECKKTFANRRNLRDHTSIVHAKDESKYTFECEACGKRFYKKSNYESHLVKHDVVVDMIRCTEDGCEATFKRAKSMKAHAAAMHGAGADAKKSYLCADCGKRFASVTGYRQHVGKHTGVPYLKRAHACPDCGKSFRSPADLGQHRVVHTKAKRFACDVCDALFSQKSSLADHYNVHLNRFACHVCKKAFGRQRYLDNHVKSCELSAVAKFKARQVYGHDIIVEEEPQSDSGMDTAVVLAEIGDQKATITVEYSK